MAGFVSSLLLVGGFRFQFSASFIRSILEFITAPASYFISFTSRVSWSWLTFRFVMVIKREAGMSHVSQYQWIFADCLVKNSYLVLVRRRRRRSCWLDMLSGTTGYISHSLGPGLCLVRPVYIVRNFVLGHLFSWRFLGFRFFLLGGHFLLSMQMFISCSCFIFILYDVWFIPF